jgi:hypothetical protein
MPVTNVDSKWESGALNFRNNSGESILKIAAEALTFGKGTTFTQYDAVATSDGLTTGTIPDGATFVSVTSASANNIVVLPTPTPGTLVVVHVGANGCELRSSAPATVAINGGTGASAESAIGANVTAFLFCVTATSWKGWQSGADGTLALVEAAA